MGEHRQLSSKFLRRAPEDAGHHVAASCPAAGRCQTGVFVDRTKPQPDLVSVATDKLPPCHDFVMIGDATWDAIAAARVGVPTIGLLSGGFGEEELLGAGCRSVYADAANLAVNLAGALRVVPQPQV
jgi:phosphoglycolate phosphatase-like HAD superfamily hydrolase